MDWRAHPIEFTLIVGAGVCVLALFLRLVLPVLLDLCIRAWLNGPAPTASPGGTGSWAGWVVSFLWSISERNREERYEHARDLGLQRTSAAELEAIEAEEALIVHPDIDLPPRFAHTLKPLAPPPAVAHDQPVMSPDRRWWWDGRHWQDCEQYVPTGVKLNGDGSRWWDGAQWRVSPARIATRYRNLPRAASWEPAATETETWLTARGVGMAPRRPPVTQHPKGSRWFRGSRPAPPPGSGWGP